MIVLTGVTKSYSGRAALRPLDLGVEAGRVYAVVGPSGCGKSTLLRILVGLVTPDAGSVRFHATELTPASAAAVRRRIGYVNQDGGLFPHLTAERNVTLMARQLSWPRERIGERLHELLRLTRLSPDLLARYPLQLSGGQRQRVSLMRALMLDPELLLLDEPLGALDPLVRADLQEDLRAIFRSLAKTVIVVTHDLGEAAFFGDEIIVMRDGAIVQRGTARQLVESPADPFVTRFINAERSPLDAAAGAAP